MEEIMERPGLLARLTARIRGEEEVVEYYEDAGYDEPVVMRNKQGAYRISVRRQVESYDDAIEAADGLRKGEQQILNLCHCPAQLREKIKDFMSGVNYAMEGEWVELGDNVYLLAPNIADVEIMPASDAMYARRN